MDRAAWRATVHRVTKSWTWLKWLSVQAGVIQPSQMKFEFSHLYTKYWHTLQCGWAFKHYAKWKKPDTKDHMLYDFIYEITKTCEPIDTESGFVVAVGWKKRKDCLVGTDFLLGWWEYFGTEDRWLYSVVAISNATKLFTLIKQLILSYMNFTRIFKE